MSKNQESKDAYNEIRAIEQRDRGYQLTELEAEGVVIPDSVRNLQKLLHKDIKERQQDTSS